MDENGFLNGAVPYEEEARTGILCPSPSNSPVCFCHCLYGVSNCVHTWVHAFVHVLCMYTHAQLPQPAYRSRKTTSDPGPYLSPCLRQGYLQASGSSISIPHLTMRALELQTHGLLCPVLSELWGFELRHSQLHGKCFTFQAIFSTLASCFHSILLLRQGLPK